MIPPIRRDILLPMSDLVLLMTLLPMDHRIPMDLLTLPPPPTTTIPLSLRHPHTNMALLKLSKLQLCALCPVLEFRSK